MAVAGKTVEVVVAEEMGSMVAISDVVEATVEQMVEGVALDVPAGRKVPPPALGTGRSHQSRRSDILHNLPRCNRDQGTLGRRNMALTDQRTSAPRQGSSRLAL